jgi:hypothetical protein
MRIGDLLYFGPGLRFDQVDLDGPELPKQFENRMIGFYIEPAEKCARCGYAFAAGVLLVSCIDALARLRFRDGVGRRFRKFVCKELRSFSADSLAQCFYDDFRNGLVHEARLKNGGQFSLETNTTVAEFDGLLLINPACLAQEVRVALHSYVTVLSQDDRARARLALTLRRDHSDDFRVAQA